MPGIVGGDGARVLSVMAPGANDAIVKVRVLSPDGTFAPADRSTLEVPADAVVTLDMSPVLDKQPSTLELTSDVPIVAGMRMFFGGKNVQDETAYTAGSEPFNGPAAVSGLPVRTNTDVRVSITAPDTAAAVDITLLPYRGGKDAAQPTSPRRVKIGAGKVKYVKLNPPAGIAWYTAVVTPVEGSGPVLVAHRVRESVAVRRSRDGLSVAPAAHAGRRADGQSRIRQSLTTDPSARRRSRSGAPDYRASRESPPLFQAFVQRGSRFHADVRLRGLDGGPRPAGHLCRAALL